LVWLAMAVLAIATNADSATIAANFLFTANFPPAHLMTGGGPLWSLCVEIHFYIGVALLVGVLGRRGLFVLPVLALAITTARIVAGETISIVTWHRVDEILAGATVALFVEVRRDRSMQAVPAKWSCIVMLVALVVSAHPLAGPLGYLRPYFAAAAVGTSLLAAPTLLVRVWTSRPARYVAEISYALYVFHGMFTATWLGGDEATKLQRYARRPLLIATTLLAAHLSTFYYEKRFIALGKRLASQVGRRERAVTAGH
jgi:peptidoglycan/LPS O-acetylase OafA/YrhL